MKFWFQKFDLLKQNAPNVLDKVKKKAGIVIIHIKIAVSG